MFLIKKIYLTGFLAYLGLFIMALVFYRERTVFIDIGFHLFVMMRDGGLAIQNYRFGAAITQALPLLLIKQGAALKSIVIGYSVVFIIYYLLCYIVCGLVYKNYGLALVLMLLNILFVADSFYWTQSELQQGLAFLIVYFSYLGSLKDDSRYIFHVPLIVVGTTTIAFFHPLLAFPFIFFTLFFFLQKNIPVKWLFTSLILWFIAAAGKSVFFKTAYDAQAMDGLRNFRTHFPDYFRLHTNKTFLISCITEFYWIPVFFTAIVIVYLRQRSWLKLLVFLSFFGGYLLLINVSYATAGATSFYMENMYLVLNLILGLPVVFDLLPLMQRRPSLALVTTVLIIVTGFLRIYQAHKPYKARLNWEEQFLAAHLDSKVLMKETPELRDKLIMTWGTPYEFWLLSTMDYGRTASIIISDNLSQYDVQKENRQAFYEPWGVTGYQALPARYFIFKDTVSVYKVLNQ